MNRTLRHLPNILSVLRILLAAAAAILLLRGGLSLLPVLLCVVAALLDAVDGFAARRLNACTALGVYLDPIADKVLMAVIFVFIAIRLDSTPLWVLLAVIAWRDATVTLLRTAEWRRAGRCIAASKVGKTKMVVQSTAGIALLAWLQLAPANAGQARIPALVTVAVIAVLSLLSARGYFIYEHRNAETVSPLAKGVVADQDKPPLATPQQSAVGW